jgi:hypothetical protein
MKKLVALMAIGGALVAGLPIPASAVPLNVTIQCTTFFGSPPVQQVFGVQASTGVTLPPACVAGGSCTNCINQVRLLPGGFSLTTAFGGPGATSISQAITGYAGPYFLLQQF